MGEEGLFQEGQKGHALDACAGRVLSIIRIIRFDIIPIKFD